MTSEQAEQFGPYRILQRIGRGAMGAVFHARDARGRDVALKIMLPDLASDEGARERFVREAQAAAGLQHRNIITVLDCGVHDDTPYIAMELLKGESLKARLARREPLSLDRKLDIVVQLCEGLQFAHDRGVVHRDVKPANIWLLENGAVKLLDFGIAKVGGSALTRVGELVGSGAYMSPEQVSGREVDGRSDIFAAGVVLYELLTGRRPFEADNLTGVINKILHEDPPPLRALLPGLPEDIEAAVTTALTKDVDARYAQAADFGADLRLARYNIDETPTPAIAPPEAATIVITDATRIRASDPGHSAEPTLSRPSEAGGAAVVAAPASQPLPGAQAPSSLTARRGLVLWLAAGLGLAVVLAVLARGFWTKPSVTWSYDVRSAPAGASIALDGVETGKRTPAVVTVTSHPTRIALALNGFERVDVALREAGDTTTDAGTSKPVDLNFTLRRLLRIQSEPAGARILLDGRDTGLVTPAALPVPDPPPASVELQLGPALRKAMPLTPALLASGELTIELGDRAAARPASPPSASPSGPSAREPREPAGTTPVTVRVTGGYPFEVTGCGTTSAAAAEHDLDILAPCTLRFRAPEYYLDVTRKVEASGGRVEIAVPQLARVTLRSRYEACNIALAGRAVGTPPVELELAAGDYTAAIQCPDRTYTGSVPIQPGRTIRSLDDFLR